MILSMSFISIKLGFDKCQGDCKLTINTLMLANKILLACTVVVWALVAGIHSRGTVFAEQLIKQGTEEKLEPQSRLSPELLQLKKEFHFSPLETSIELPKQPFTAVPYESEKKRVSLPVSKALQVISFSALGGMHWLSQIAFLTCVLFFFVCVMARLLVSAAENKVTHDT